jgi:hypothetical protein
MAHVPLDGPTLSFTFRQTIERLALELLESPEEDGVMERLGSLLALRSSLPFEIDVWKAQNSYYRLRKRLMPDLQKLAAAGDTEAQKRIASLRSLGQKLQFREE